MKYKEVNEMHRGLFTQAKSVLLSVMGQIERYQIAELRPPRCLSITRRVLRVLAQTRDRRDDYEIPIMLSKCLRER